MFIEQVMAYCGRYFEKWKIHGAFTVSDEGALSPLPALKDGDYLLIHGSDYNDGVHLVGDTLIAEEFTGYVLRLIPPPAFVALSVEIETWAASSDNQPTALSSESVGGYSRAWRADPVTWATAYGNKLAQYRKLPKNMAAVIYTTPDYKGG